MISVRSVFGSAKWMSTQYLAPTVYALSTPPGMSAIGVIRITGPSCTTIFKSLTGSKADPKPRVSSLRKLCHPQTGVMLDEALTLFFKGPLSYTGEDLLELHLHGGTAVINGVIQAIEDSHGAEAPIRRAERGEFSRRAFQNGRFDLTELEGINSLIHAETESQRLMSLTSMKGETHALFAKWRAEIVNNVALLTTIIDFGEEHGVEETEQIFKGVKENIIDLQEEIRAYIKRLDRSQLLLRGIQTVLLGPPNAGKSSLLNVLSNSNTAIVSDIAGTTRDIINVPLDINGYKVVVGDAAGIRSLETADQIEAEGIKRAMDKSITSDLILVILPVDNMQLDDEFVKHIRSMASRGKQILVVMNKSDLLNEGELESVLQACQNRLGLSTESFQVVSCATGDGVDRLVGALTDTFKCLTWSDYADPVSISDRAKDILVKDVLYGFEEFLLYTGDTNDVVLASESLRYSIEGIGKITGEAVGIEEILGVVFSSFCIGK